MSQLKKGAILSYVNILLTILIGLVLTPFIIHSLGNSEYGLYTLIGSFVAYLSLMDLGLNNTIIRFVAKYRAENDLLGEKNFLGSIFIIYSIISIVLALIGVFLYFKLGDIFSDSLSLEEIRKAKIMFQILVFNVVITLPGGAFTAICNAYEYFVLPRLVSIFKYLFRGITIVSILTMGGKAISLVIIDTVLNIITILIIAFFVFFKLKVRINFKGIEKPLLKIIFSYSIWIFVFSIIQTFQWNVGQMILGMKTNTTEVAVFGIGIMLGSYYGAFSSAINGVLLPKATHMSVANSTGSELTQVMIQVGRLNVMIQFFILAGFILLGRIFINLWVGPDYNNSWTVAVLVMLVMTIPLSQSFGNSILEGKNKVRYKAILNLITMFLGVIVGYYCAEVYGFQGVIIPIVVALFINTIITNYYYVTVFGFDFKKFYKEVFAKQTLFIVSLTLIFFYLLQFFSIDTWFKFAISGLLFMFIYAIFYYLFLLDKKERVLFTTNILK